MSRRTRITLYLVLIAAGLGFLAYWQWDADRHHRTLAVLPTQEYWLHVPDRCVSERNCPVFVFVHGTGGSGRDFIRTWRAHAEREGFILICPTFGDGYQWLSGGEADLLPAIHDEVRQRYGAADRMIVSGFSGGAQFASRFAFARPERVQAVAVHSAGSYDSPPDHARHIPFLVTVGARDTDRVDIARWFAAELQSRAYAVTWLEVEGVGHDLSDAAIQITLEWMGRLGITRRA